MEVVLYDCARVPRTPRAPLQSKYVINMSTNGHQPEHNNQPDNFGYEQRIKSLEAMKVTLESIKHFVRTNDPTSLVAAVIIRKDVCASTIYETLGSGTEHYCHGKMIAQLDSARNAFKEELRMAKKTKLPRPVKKLIREVNGRIDTILGKLAVRTNVTFDELGKENEALQKIAQEGKAEVMRWANGNPKTPRVKTHEEHLKEAGQLLRRALGKLELTGDYAAKVTSLVEGPVDQASKLIADLLADHAAKNPTTSNSTVSNPASPAKPMDLNFGPDLNAA